MNKHILNWFLDSGGASGVTAEYQAILDRATTLGYSHPSAAQKIKQNTFLAALKTAGAWDELDVLYMIWNDVAGNFWRINWKSPSNFEITEPAGSLTKASNAGVTSNGTTTYGTTSWIPATNAVKYQLNDSSIFVYINNESAQAKYAISVIGAASGESRLAPKWTDNNFYGTMNSASSNFNTYANASSIGFYQLVRDGASSLKLYKNGSLVDTESKASNSLPATNPLLICSASTSGGTQSTYQIGFAAAGSALTSKASDIYNAWTAYIS